LKKRALARFFVFVATPFLCFVDIIFGGSATAVPAFKVSAKNGLFLGQMTADAARGSHLSGA
jgi:hypothetical protein